MTVRYVLAPPSADRTATPPVLDDDQQAVVDHDGGPQLVLAGPGTGKTTTLVEAVVDRVEQRGLRPEQALVLTFSRKAADELRARVAARLGRTTAGAVAMTFHSFCYALVRRFSLLDPLALPAGADGGPQLTLPLAADPDPLAWRPPTLMSVPEQDVRIRDLLRGSAPTREPDGDASKREPDGDVNALEPDGDVNAREPDGDVNAREPHGDVSTALPWPRALLPALRTKGLAAELRAVLARARALGLDPEDLAALGRGSGVDGWVAAAGFFDTYLESLDPQGLLDYGELVHRAVVLARDPVNRQLLRDELRFVVVDEYQDTDPAQVALLRALAGDGRDLLVVGDPDQAIYAFRGADVGGILRFPSDFRRSDGRPAEVRALRATRRFGPGLLTAASSVARRIPLKGLADRAELARFRDPVSVDAPYGRGRVEVRLFTSAAAEAEHVADLLRRAHLGDGVEWAQMAVLVRSGKASIPLLRRALTAAGVPVEVAGDEVPLRSEAAVQVLLLALRVADRLHRAGTDAAAGDGTFGGDGHPLVRPDEAQALLLSPLGGLDPAALRRLARALRRRDRDDHVDVRLPRPSAELVAQSLVDPRALDALASPDARRAGRLAALLAEGARLLATGANAEDLLWHVWSGTGWPGRLRAAAEGGSRSAHRDLDAVLALFDRAARAEHRRRGWAVHAFLAEVDAQQIPAGTLAEQGVRGSGVRLLTAHRAKGLQWRLVVVAGVQEGGWPDLRRQGSLLHVDRLDRAGRTEPPALSARLADERRLFYVAVTRARERVVVTAVSSPAEDGDQPSRFLADLGVPVPAEPEARPRRPLSLAGLLGELRAMSEATDDDAVRTQVAARVARLVEAGGTPGAHPDRWWGVHEVTAAEAPVRPDDQPLKLSGSALDGLVTCPLRWFLSREAGGATAASAAQGFGSLVHGLAEAVVRGDVQPDVEQMVAYLDRVWDQLDFAVPWAGAAERREAEQAVARFVGWHLTDRGRETLAAEHEFQVTVPVGDDEVVLRGSMDRVEADVDGRVVVVDFKTGKHPPKDVEVAAQPQLGVYQLAVRHGAADTLLERAGLGQPGEPGGAELVHLRKEVRGEVKVQHQPAPGEDTGWVGDDQLAGAVRTVRTERFQATPGPRCERCEFRTSCPAQPEGGGIVVVDGSWEGGA